MRFSKRKTMDTKINEIEVNGVKYVPKDSIAQVAAYDTNGLPYVIVRAYGAGVFAGYLAKEEETPNGTKCTLRNVRRLWYWDGAASCSDLARKGVSKPQNCKFPAPITEARISNCIEVLPATDIARKSIEGVKIWEA